MFKKCLPKTGLLSARELHELPNHIHSKLANYLSASDLKSISQVSHKLRKIYPKLAYEQCLFLEGSYFRFQSRLTSVECTVFVEPDKYRWFPCEHVKVIVFDHFSIGRIQYLDFPYFHLSLYFPRLRHIVFNGEYMDPSSPIMPVFATAPNVFMLSGDADLEPTSFDRSIRFLDVIPCNRTSFVRFDRFSNLTCLKMAFFNSEKNLREKFKVFKSLQYNNSIKYLTIEMGIKNPFVEILKHCPGSVTCFKVTFMFEESDFELTGHGNEMQKQVIDLSRVTHLEFRTGNQWNYARKSYLPTFFEPYVYHTPKLKSLYFSQHIEPHDLDFIHDKFSSITTLFLTIPLGHEYWFDFSKLDDLNNLKHFAVSFGSGPELPEDRFFDAYSTVQSFISEAREKCWRPQSHTLHITHSLLKKLNNPKFYRLSPELLYGFLLYSTKRIVSEVLPEDIDAIEDWGIPLIMKILHLRDLLGLALNLENLEYLEVFYSNDILNNIQLLPLVYEHKKLKYLAFKDFTEYEEDANIPKNVGIDKSNMAFKKIDHSSFTNGVIDVEGIRKNRECKNLNLAMDLEHFQFPSLGSKQVGVFGSSRVGPLKNSIFEDRINLLTVSDGSEEME